ncbi:ScbR family autoregulator-binding transcription factor [Mycolicibacterium phlei]
MVRQARSEATRRRIIAAAVALFNDVGYPATGLGDIIERAEMTKGALYYHFDSKEALATAIIQEGTNKLIGAFAPDSSAPALERVIHGSFQVADLLNNDDVARCGGHLLRVIGDFNAVAAQTYNGWLEMFSAGVAEAAEEGDIRPDVDLRAVGETVVCVMLGMEVLSTAMSSRSDVLERLARVWQVLLPAIVVEESLDYFREYVARESMRRAPDTE